MYDLPVTAAPAALPQLDRALDAQAMGTLFAERLWGDPASGRRATVRACAIEHVRHRYGKCCVIGYRVGIDTGDNGPERELRFAARAYPIAQSAAAFTKATLGQHAATPHSPPLFHVPDLGLIVWAFPNDRKLAGLRALGGGGGLRERVLPLLGSELRCDTHALERAQVALVHYVPEHGCTFRIATGSEVFFAKCHTPASARRSRSLLDALWSSNARRAGRLHMPEPLLLLDQYDMLWTRGLAGRTLLACWIEDPSTSARFAAAAEVLAALHVTDEVRAPDVTRAALIDKLHRVTVTARALAPANATAIARIAARLEYDSHVLDTCETVTLHGDLHPQNILCTAREAALLDFDGLAKGPAVLDLGSFSAAMRYQSLLAGRDEQASTAALTQFIDAYAHASGASVDPRALHWSTAFALVAERAYRCMTRMKPGRAALVQALVTQADALLTPSGTVRARPGSMRSAVHG